MNPYHECDAVTELDLEQIKVKLMHKQSGEGWTRAKADEVEVEYRRFLYLNKKYPNEQISPSVEVDVFWHYHILDTMKYARDCDQVFGYFLHHFPYIGLGEESTEEDRLELGQRTEHLYAREFGQVEDPLELTPVAAGRAWCAAPSKPAWCAAPSRKADTAWCAAPSVKLDSAWCAAPSVKRVSAWCAAPSRKLDSAWCAAPSTKLANAWCAAPSKKQDTGWCASPAKHMDTAWCAAPARKLDTAWCAAPSKQATAWCAAPGKPASSAWCAAPSKTATAA